MKQAIVGTAHENVYMDTSAVFAKRSPLELVRFLKPNLPQKVLFGTNFLISTPGKALEGLDALDLHATRTCSCSTSTDKGTVPRG